MQNAVYLIKVEERSSNRESPLNVDIRSLSLTELLFPYEWAIAHYGESLEDLEIDYDTMLFKVWLAQTPEEDQGATELDQISSDPDFDVKAAALLNRLFPRKDPDPENDRN